MQKTQVQLLSGEDPLEKEMAPFTPCPLQLPSHLFIPHAEKLLLLLLLLLLLSRFSRIRLCETP